MFGNKAQLLLIFKHAKQNPESSSTSNNQKSPSTRKQQFVSSKRGVKQSCNKVLPSCHLFKTWGIPPQTRCQFLATNIPFFAIPRANKSRKIPAVVCFLKMFPKLHISWFKLDYLIAVHVQRQPGVQTLKTKCWLLSLRVNWDARTNKHLGSWAENQIWEGGSKTKQDILCQPFDSDNFIKSMNKFYDKASYCFTFFHVLLCQISLGKMSRGGLI